MKKLLLLFLGIFMIIPVAFADTVYLCYPNRVCIEVDEDEMDDYFLEENWRKANSEPLSTNELGLIELSDYLTEYDTHIKIVEVGVPDGYQADTITHIVPLEDKEITILNNKMPTTTPVKGESEPVKNPETGNINLMPLLIILAISLIAVVILTRKAQLLLILVLFIGIPLINAATSGFTIKKVDQYNEPVKDAKFDIYLEPWEVPDVPDPNFFIQER